MMEADASASVVPTAEREGTSVALPFHPGDRWVGTYTCRQGPTDMTITFDEVGLSARDEGDARDAVAVSAVFEFHFDGNGQPGFTASEGAARMRGTYDLRTRKLRLNGTEWIDQPANYTLINLVGVVNPRASARSAAYSGTVEGGACTSFTAHPDDFDAETQEKPGSRPLPPRSLPRPRP